MTEYPSSITEPTRKAVRLCWLHVGMHKTGTTAVQANLAKMKMQPDWRLMKVGGRANMGKALCAMFASNPNKHSAFAKLGVSYNEIVAEGEVLKKKLRRSILRAKQDTIIISAEAMSVAIDKKGIIALKDFLEPLCDEIRVIGYVRPPLGFKISIFQEGVKHGNKVFDIADRKVNYRRRFKKFDDVFGRKKVILRKFDPSTFPHQCIVSDFCEQIGIVGPERREIMRTNESLKREACGILYAYRKFGPGYGVGEGVMRENGMIMAPLFKLKGDKFKISKALIAVKTAEEAEDIKWMEKRLGTQLQEIIEEDGTEISSEEELLKVKGSSCLDYVRHFEEINGRKISTDKIPTGEFADPEAIAALVEHCRTLSKAFLHETRANKNSLSSRCRSRVDRWLRKLRSLLYPKTKNARKQPAGTA